MIINMYNMSKSSVRVSNTLLTPGTLNGKERSCGGSIAVTEMYKSKYLNKAFKSLYK